MRLPNLWFAVASVLTVSGACSVDPLVPDGKGGTGGGAGQGGTAGTSASGGTMGNAGTGGSDCGFPPPIVPCQVGRTVVECVTGPMGNHWSVSCPDDPTGAGGGSMGGAGGGVPCASTSGC